MKTEKRRLPTTYAAVVFKAVDLDPDLVSAILCKQPTLSFCKGEPHRVKDAELTRRFGLWVYSTRKIVASNNLNDHLDVIEELLIGAKPSWPDSRLNKIREMVECHGAQLRVDVFWYGDQAMPLPMISRSFDQVVTMAGGSISTDFHRDEEVVAA